MYKLTQVFTFFSLIAETEIILINDYQEIDIHKPLYTKPGGNWTALVVSISTLVRSILSVQFGKSILIQYIANPENQVGFQVVGFNY